MGLSLEGDYREVVSPLIWSLGRSCFRIYSPAKLARENLVSLISPKYAKLLPISYGLVGALN